MREGEKRESESERQLRSLSLLSLLLLFSPRPPSPCTCSPFCYNNVKGTARPHPPRGIKAITERLASDPARSSDFSSALLYFLLSLSLLPASPCASPKLLSLPSLLLLHCRWSTESLPEPASRRHFGSGSSPRLLPLSKAGTMSDDALWDSVWGPSPSGQKVRRTALEKDTTKEREGDAESSCLSSFSSPPSPSLPLPLCLQNAPVCSPPSRRALSNSASLSCALATRTAERAVLQPKDRALVRSVRRGGGQMPHKAVARSAGCAEKGTRENRARTMKKKRRERKKREERQ